MPDDVLVARLVPADVDAAYRLSSAVGWNQTRADWRRLLDLNPSGCFGARSGVRLIATATLAAFPEGVGWVGMVIVDEAFRGRGLGRTLLQRVLEHGTAVGTARLGLDATALGRPLYEKNGFQSVRRIDRWGGSLIPSTDAVAVHDLRADDLRDVFELDRRACGVDRAPLLRALVNEDGNRAWVMRDDDVLVAFGILRPGREHAHLGPLVASSRAGVVAVLDAVAQALAGRTVFVDALRSEGTVQALSAHGLQIERELIRMHVRSLPVTMLQGEMVIAAVGLEWG